MIRSTMQRVPLSVNHLLERAGRLYPQSEIVSRLPDKSLARHRFADFHRRSRQLASALLAAGLQRGDRVATLCWNHHAHLECYFGIPAAGGVMHTLNLRLTPEEIAWIANHARDRFLIVDDILLPLYEQFRTEAPFERVIVFPFSRAAVPAGFTDYEAFLAGAPEAFEFVPHEEDDAIAMCYTSGTTGRPKGVVYSHRSTVIHTLMASERPLPCVVLKPGKSATPDELRAHLSGNFAKWQLPERFEFLDAIPRTSTGKFWKVKLRERFVK